ncbi:MAG: PEP-CTERM sorting domain-containing protein [Planctomycetota bacterium]
MKSQIPSLAMIGSMAVSVGVSADVITVFDYDFEDGANQGGLTAVSTATLPASVDQGDFAGSEEFAFNGGGGNQFAPSGSARNLGLLNVAFNPNDVLNGEATLSADIRFEEPLDNNNMNLRIQVLFRLDDNSTVSRNVSIDYDQASPADVWFEQSGTISVPANATEVVRGFVQFGVFGCNNDLATSSTYYIDNFSLTYEQVPEPGSMALLGSGLLILGARGRVE